MTSWQRKALSSVASVGSGSGFPIAEQGSTEGQFPFLKVSDMNLEGNERSIHRWNNSVTEEVRQRLRATAFPAGSVIFPKIGAAIGTNKKRLLTRPSCVDNNVMAIVPNASLIDPQFLYFLLLTKDLSEFASDSNPPSIRKTVVEEWCIPVPALAEQRRFADLLSRAEGIVRLRREAQKKAAKIIPALFLDMFGDPATNPKGWPLVTLGDHVEIASVVRTPDLERDASRLCIGADSIESSSGTFLHCPTVQGVSPRSGKYWFEANDVLYSKIRPYLAKAAIARTSGYCSADMYPLHCNRSIEPSFLLHLLLSKAFTDFATGESVRAQMPKLNRETLFGFRFPLPPATRQSQFSELASRVEAIRDQHAFARAKCESSFTALLIRAFAVGGNGSK